MPAAATAIPAPMEVHDPDFIKWAFCALKFGNPGPDDLNREIIITPFAGNYGLAGYVMAVNGSPPKAIVVVDQYGVAFRRLDKTIARTKFQSRQTWDRAIGFLTKHGCDIENIRWEA